MPTYNKLLNLLHKEALPEGPYSFSRFFKPGHGDIFLGVKTQSLRKIAKAYYQEAQFSDICKLMDSNVYEERTLASHLLVIKYKKAPTTEKHLIVDFYLQNRKHIHDWSNVDNSAPYILGPHLLHQDKSILYSLAESLSLWDRRIAMVTTWWFIRNGEYLTTLALAEKLLKDKEDLIQKATGWMLREMGKKEPVLLENFLKKHSSNMPRITLSYAIEKFPKEIQALYRKKALIN